MIEINDNIISNDSDTYFIADIAANHDGSIEKAKELIYLCAEAGADAAKFQHFSAESIVSDFGFKSLDCGTSSHQSGWKESVFDVYKNASLDQDWTPILEATCKNAGIDFLTSPYSFDLVDAVDQYVDAYKVGSGDITWLEIIKYMASKNKPIFIATGASSFNEVRLAVNTALKETNDIVLMQCNTNYTSSLENFKYINLNVLKRYRKEYPGIILGLSDHTPGHATVLGAVSFGARVIEKHFTNNVNKKGPDHKFSRDFDSWKDMVDRTKELEMSLGSDIKKVEYNENETVVLQRRSVRVKRSLKKGETLTRDAIELLRPCPLDAIGPDSLEKIVGRRLVANIALGDYVTWKDLK